MSEIQTAPGLDGSILLTMKKMLGLDMNYNAYDTDIIVFINSAMMTLQQLGIGPERGFAVTGLQEKWSDFIPSDTMLEGVKHYLFLCVKMVFDPPTSSFVLDSMKTQKEELEWRLREQVEFYPGDGTRKGYWEGQSDVEVTPSGAIIYHGNSPDTYYEDGGFRAHGGRYASDPDYPWKDGPSQPAIIDSEGDG